MSVEFPLAELAATMMREVFKAINDSAMEQVETYAELVAQVSLSEDDYRDKMAGATESDRLARAESYLREVVLPTLGMSAGALPDPLLLSHENRAALLQHYARVNATVDGSPSWLGQHIQSAGTPFPWRIYKEPLMAFTVAKLLADAVASHRKLQAMLGAGLPNIVVTGGQVCTKVTMRVEEQASTSAPTIGAKASAGATMATKAASPLALRVRVANERSALTLKSSELVGSVRIDFRTGNFPPPPSGG